MVISSAWLVSMMTSSIRSRSSGVETKRDCFPILSMIDAFTLRDVLK